MLKKEKKGAKKDFLEVGAESDGTKIRKVGPWGGHGGSSWDDGTFTGVREITLVYDSCIDSIRVEYDKGGKKVLAEKHGGNGGNYTANPTVYQVKLQYPGEILTGVSGHYDPMPAGGTPVIRSLTFQSNKKIFGPFGVEEGTPFTFPINGDIVVGFTGRSGWYLDSIGLRLSRRRPKSLLQLLQKILKTILCGRATMSKASEK
ncbi:Jacalin-related lectin 19 [Asimina triloba]